MKLRKIFYFIIIFFFVFTTITNAVDTNLENITSDATEEKAIDINISDISSNFNNNSYVSKIANLGIKLSSIQDSNSLILNYDNIYSLNYSIDDSTKTLTTSYSILNHDAYLKYDILNALLIDTISTMQGNLPGVLIPFALSDTYCYSLSGDAGISKNYIQSENDTPAVEFQICTNIKFSIPESSNSISESKYRTQYETFFTNADCIVKEDDMIFYKTFLEDGSIVFYIGEPNELTSRAYESILTAVDVFFNYKDLRVSNYFKENYNDISVGNFNFDGVSIDTSITELPISTIDTILVLDNMKYAKFTINRDTINQRLDSISNDDNNDSSDYVQINNNKSPMVVIIIVIILLIILLISLIRFFINKYNFSHSD